MHVLGAYLRWAVFGRMCWYALAIATREYPEGYQPFAKTIKNDALKDLRALLHTLGIKEAAQYRTHDFRRGHARDLQRSGANLSVILQAGEWRSSAFMEYLDRDEVEEAAVLEAHWVESDSDEEITGCDARVGPVASAAP